ncbi:MAG: family 16 glycoside hydrolase [Verrucomicrobiota bacterium]|nr:family 16 glycoside hydrolase [Verrucomicrobiota bacterium]
MLRWFPLVFALIFTASAAELTFDFSKTPENETPSGFISTVAGEGKPGEWRVIMDEVPSLLPSLTGSASISRKPVLAQLSRNPLDEHYPMLVYDNEVFGDFTLTTRFKTVSGVLDRMAGIAFRYQDERNYYYVRASSTGNTFRFFKVVQGQRSAPIGPEIEIPSGKWHELKIQCMGNKISCWLNGKEVIPTLTDNSFTSGKIAFWTKSDSVSYFAETRISYKPRESLAQALIRETQEKYSRVLKVRIYARQEKDGPIQVIGTTDPADAGKLAEKVELDVIERGSSYFGRQKGYVIVTMPLHDHNGDTVAAVRLELKSFPGQTEQNALARCLPIIKDMERRLGKETDFF